MQLQRQKITIRGLMKAVLCAALWTSLWKMHCSSSDFDLLGFVVRLFTPVVPTVSVSLRGDRSDSGSTPQSDNHLSDVMPNGQDAFTK
jgi:hypothetical protein